MAELAFSYATILKQEKQEDGTLKVYGKATDDSVDIDSQICDETWLQQAMPQWFETGGNIREQHSNIAAGVATDYELKSDGHYITAHVVDPVSVKKVEAGVLKGFSIGIRSPRIIRDNKAANGRIVDGQIVEVSLVDRPANPNAKLMLAKAADNGDLEMVKQVSIPTPASIAPVLNKFNENHDEGGRFASSDNSGITNAKNSLSQATRIVNRINENSPESRAAKTNAKLSLDEARRRIDEAQNHAANSKPNEASAALHFASQQIMYVADALRNVDSASEMKLRGHSYDIGQAAINTRANKGADNGELEMVKQVSIPTPGDLAALITKGSPDQARDEQGRFASSDGGSDGGVTSHDTTGSGAEGINGAGHGGPGDNAGFGEHITNLQTGLETLNSHFNAIAAREGRDVAPHEKAMLESNREHLNDALTALRNGNSEGARGYLNIAAASINRIAGSMGSRGANSDEIAAAEGIGRQAYAATTASDNKGADADLAKFNDAHDESGRFAPADGGAAMASAHEKLSNLAERVSEKIKLREDSPRMERLGVKDRVDAARSSADKAKAKLDEAEKLRNSGDFNGSVNAAFEATNHLLGANTMLGLTESDNNPLQQSVNVLDSAIRDASDAHQSSLHAGKSATVGNTDTKVETMTNETVNTEKSVVTADIKKFDEDLFNTAIKALGDLIAVEAGEAAEGHDESDSIKHLLKAIKHLKKWYQGEVAEGEVANPNPAMLDQDSDVEDADVEPEEIYLSADKAADEKPAIGEEKPVDGEEPGKCDKCDKAEGECKCADKSDKSATLDLAVDDAVTSTIIEKAVQSAKQAVEAELEQLKSVTAVAEQRAVELEAQLTDALSKAAAGGPVRSGIKTKSVNVDDLLVKAAEFRNKASLTQDRTLSDGYRELAEDLEKKARKGRK